jgi:hypothetical protein
LAKYREEQERLHAAVRSEPLTILPDGLTVEDFERFSLKVALYALDVDEARNWPPEMREPDLLALRIKEILLRQLPEEYVRTWEEGTGWSRRVRYAFKSPVPKSLVLEAMRTVGFTWNDC